MSRKKNQRTELNDLLWQRVGEILEQQGKRYHQLWKLVHRNKNTYTSWLKKRTMPQISDLQELSEALNVAPADLLQPSSAISGQAPVQAIQLPVMPGSKPVRFELEWSQAGIVLRKIGNSGTVPSGRKTDGSAGVSKTASRLDASKRAKPLIKSA